MKISIQVNLNRDCRNTRRANICLYSRMLQSSNFQGASTFVGATWLRIYRSHVYMFAPCTCQRLTDFQRILLTGSTGGETGTLASLLHYNYLRLTKSIFLSVELDQFCRELVYIFERYNCFSIVTIYRVSFQI